MKCIKIPTTQFTAALVISLTALVSACDSSTSAPTITVANSAALKPADAELEALYNRSCRSCHTIPGSGAPLTGDAKAWQPRMEKGMATLVDNVVNGFGGMPPFGLCMDCDARQIEGLIHFMAAEPQ